MMIDFFEILIIGFLTLLAATGLFYEYMCLLLRLVLKFKFPPRGLLYTLITGIFMTKVTSKPITLVLSVMAILFTKLANAHFPLMNCWLESEKVVCQAGYSDGSSAVKYDVNVYDYDDNLIAKLVTDKRSKVEFNRPESEFYLIFDAGHENPVEVDVVEISQK